MTLDVKRWLEDLDLEVYGEAFALNDVDGELLPRLTGEELREIGVHSVGHRRRLLEAIRALADASPAESREGEESESASRRQVTVLFADISGFTGTFESGEYQRVRIPITLKIRKTRLAISRQKVMVEKFAGLSRPAVEKVSVTTSPAGSIEFAARSNASWLWCTPETGRTDAELVLQIDGTKLGSGSHRGRIMISSEQAEEPVPIDVTLLLKKIRLQVPGQIELIGTTADDRISGRLKLDAEPPDHSVRWKAKWTGSELELNPREGKIPAEIEIVAKTKGRPAGKRRIPVIFESDDAEAPARLSVSLTLYEAGSPHAEIFPEFYRLQRAYRAWAATLTEAIPRLASEDPISGVRHLEAELPALQERAAQLQTASQHFRSTISRLEERLRKEGLEAEARKLSERARSMEYRVDSYTGETAKIISGTSVMTLKIQGEARWHTTGLQVRKRDVLFVTAKGRWTGSPEW